MSGRRCVSTYKPAKHNLFRGLVIKVSFFFTEVTSGVLPTGLTLDITGDDLSLFSNVASTAAQPDRILVSGCSRAGNWRFKPHGTGS